MSEIGKYFIDKLLDSEPDEAITEDIISWHTNWDIASIPKEWSKRAKTDLLFMLR